MSSGASTGTSCVRASLMSFEVHPIMMPIHEPMSSSSTRQPPKMPNCRAVSERPTMKYTGSATSTVLTHACQKLATVRAT